MVKNGLFGDDALKGDQEDRGRKVNGIFDDSEDEETPQPAVKEEHKQSVRGPPAAMFDDDDEDEDYRAAFDPAKSNQNSIKPVQSKQPTFL